MTDDELRDRRTPLSQSSAIDIFAIADA